MHEIEIWVAMDENGLHAVAIDAEGIDGAGDDADLKTGMRRVVCIKARMAAPVHQEVTCRIPDHGDGPIDVLEVAEGGAS